ncbi:MAG: hypothetical protein WC588_05705 [Candidatus Micrarchaeia archaeon]
MLKANRGVYCTVAHAPAVGFVQKKLAYPLSGRTAKSLLAMHEQYVRMLKPIVNVPETRMAIEKQDDGKYEVTILQQDLSKMGGARLHDLLSPDTWQCGGDKLFSLYLRSTVGFASKAMAHWGEEGKLLGLDSNPANWWVAGDGKWLFFDTMLPYIFRKDGSYGLDLRIGIESPYSGKGSGGKAEVDLDRLMGYRAAIHASFHDPVLMFRHALATSIMQIPDLATEFLEAASDIAWGMGASQLGRGCRAAIGDAAAYIDLLASFVKFIGSGRAEKQ